MDPPPQFDTGYVPGTHLTPRKRRYITGLHHGSLTPAEISSSTKIPLQTIRNTINFNPIRFKGESLSGRGIKKIYDYVFERNCQTWVHTSLGIAQKD
jgi:hypothetical protein